MSQCETTIRSLPLPSPLPSPSPTCYKLTRKLALTGNLEAWTSLSNSVLPHVENRQPNSHRPTYLSIFPRPSSSHHVPFLSLSLSFPRLPRHTLNIKTLPITGPPQFHVSPLSQARLPHGTSRLEMPILRRTFHEAKMEFRGYVVQSFRCDEVVEDFVEGRGRHGSACTPRKDLAGGVRYYAMD